MSAKRIFKFLVIIFLLLAAGMGGVIWLSMQTPREYAKRIDIPIAVRQENLKKVEEKREILQQDIETKPEWEFTLSEVEANSWLASSEFQDQVEIYLPQEISEPRVQLKAGEFVLAFRVTHNEFQGVVTAPLKVVSVQKDEVQIRIEEITTGLLPFSWQQIIEETLSHQQNELPVGIEWSENDEESGTLLTVRLDQLAELNWQLDEVSIEEGQLQIKGSRSFQSDDIPAAASPSEDDRIQSEAAPSAEAGGNSAPGG
ncbi:hypothetical protein Pla110_02090 [Polystyrenella longa]|uniref:Uncharacterized protein n=1 Tax=Polystyrenella longa TaxID=2528007 RepID=A0A518CH01_9PLAN|nr:hypothetical protein [Polystyrenella longa]QDU78505.1 hypothetical protein Pla110_02090 [Polystyrenella longa]